MTRPTGPPPDGGAGEAPEAEAPPAPFGWGGLYALVLAGLAAGIVALRWLSEHYR